jgi:hypothetical protein
MDRDNLKFVAAVLILLGAYSVITGDVFRILTVGKFGTSSSPETRGMLFAVWGLVIYVLALIGERKK